MNMIELYSLEKASQPRLNNVFARNFQDYNIVLLNMIVCTVKRKIPLHLGDYRLQICIRPAFYKNISKNPKPCFMLL